MNEDYSLYEWINSSIIDYTISLDDDRLYIINHGSSSEFGKQFITAYLLESPSIKGNFSRFLNFKYYNNESFDSKNIINNYYTKKILSCYREIRFFGYGGLLKRKVSLSNIDIAINLFDEKMENDHYGFIQTYIYETRDYPMELNKEEFFKFIKGIIAHRPSYARDFSIVFLLGSLRDPRNDTETDPHAAVAIIDHNRYNKEVTLEVCNYIYLLDTYPGIVYQISRNSLANNFVFGNLTNNIKCINNGGITIQEPWSCTVIASEFVKILNKKRSIDDFIEYDGNDDPICFKREVMIELINNIRELENKSGVKILRGESIKQREQILNQFLSNLFFRVPV